MTLGLTMALIVNGAIRGRTFFRSAYYFPSLVSSAAISAIAIYLLNADGLVNAAISAVTGSDFDHPWFGDADTALESIIVLDAWTTSGTMMLFYLAALQSIPTDVYEAAAIDKAGVWRTFWKITFPLLKPAHFFVAVVSVIGALKLFDQAYIISTGSGGPAGSTMTAVMYVYTVAIKEFNLRLRRDRRGRPLPHHLHVHARPATPVRQGGDRVLMADRDERRPARRGRPRAGARGRGGGRHAGRASRRGRRPSG